ncbi:arabinan endo-1,5-alpha-L-arabinosidase [Aspergillus mulundensis]|uniref:Arabinan endo-1,5-alpha-L-arabinosidase n=1 Tax=Aspergillus mulundensis TaxID=1810919 RepID=A0A3D8S5A3_9EURO|nr:Arabinan endo-1,5-alpha-L-arabinosidase [Aspergillus mulundensis]RDW81483.1 Arabinan endo-1,5-alpha-L-arabinosidase [Aspergillus mulundensis]
MKLPFSYILNLLLTLLTTNPHFPNPNPCTGDCWTHEPGLISRPSDNQYFRFATGSGIHIHSAPSLSGPWKSVGEALSNGSVIDHQGRRNLWAPDVHYDTSTNMYHMYYTVSTIGSRDSVIGLASSPDMAPESWTDHGAVFRSTNNDRYNAVDSNWVRIHGKPYLNFGSSWDGLFQVPLSLSLMKDLKEGTGGLATHAVQDALSHLASNATGHHRIEAPFLFQHRRWYYLLLSSGRADASEKNLPAQGEENRIMVCRSKNGRGEFVDKDGKSCRESGGTTLLASHDAIFGPGGQGVIEDKEYGLVLYYHYADRSLGLSTEQYRFGWNVLRWEDDWPVV